MFAVIMGATIVVLFVPIPPVDDMRDLVERAGWWGPVGFMAGYAALTLAPLPKNILSVAAGILFGFGPGLVIVYCAAMIGASAAFWLGRALGRDAVEKFTGTRVAKVDALLSKRGFAAVIGVRLIPVLPFTAINYSAGLTALGWWPYFLGTMIGIFPGTVSFLALGAFGLELGWPAQLALAVLGGLTLTGVILAVRARQKARSTDV
ncbi:putative membrane protein YdjX (TVP38/TMEM64 family) [Arthrobacter sp. CAN_A212]|uniref:TVP38/TMEM64 family protein n=1 Tax=unclassified Arthrobacter TaxID=235627 RepID=UPI0018CB6A85|nr:TVP38/TMEM64 family protein [Arthrobacter sp. CAN_C5]MBP2215022.1 putative membrane protein YdjX (TVP38/TMEM64 family) [Arthrobacter sp. CAN_C5]